MVRTSVFKVLENKTQNLDRVVSNFIFTGLLTSGKSSQKIRLVDSNIPLCCYNSHPDLSSCWF